MSFHKSLVMALAISFTLCVMASSALAAYPRTAINLICPFGAGGAGDVSARILSIAVKDDFDKPVVVVNRPGAAGVVGTTVAAQSKPDGHTLLIGRVANVGIIPALNKTISYKWDDFTYLGLLDVNPLVFVVRKDSPYKTLQELADAIKEQKEDFSFACAGALNIQELTAYMFLHSFGMDKNAATSVPFPSDAAGKNAILGGHTHFGALNLSACIDQLVEGGNLRALAVTTDRRLDAIPEVPTVREAGFPQLENILGWNSLCAPKGIPQEAVDKWENALAKLKDNKSWNDSVKASGSIPYLRGPQETTDFVRNQVEIFSKLGAELGLMIQ